MSWNQLRSVRPRHELRRGRGGADAHAPERQVDPHARADVADDRRAGAKLLGGATLLGGGAGAAVSIGVGGATAGGGLLGLTGGQVAVRDAASAIGIGGGLAALDGGSHPSRHPHPPQRVLASARAAATQAPRLRAAPRPPGRPRPARAVGRPDARPTRRAAATPQPSSTVEPRLAQIGSFRLMWHEGALGPTGLRSGAGAARCARGTPPSSRRRRGRGAGRAPARRAPTPRRPRRARGRVARAPPPGHDGPVLRARLRRDPRAHDGLVVVPGARGRARPARPSRRTGP